MNFDFILFIIDKSIQIEFLKWLKAFNRNEGFLVEDD